MRTGDYTFKIEAEDKVYCYGVDFGGDLYLLENNSKYLLLSKTGKTVHLQRTDYVYSEPTYYIFRIERIYKEDKITRIECTKLESLRYNRTNKKEQYQKILKKFNEVSK